ncbi:hypothetical protein KSB_22970 [Ktedonobacter robiniae]|uniref:Uncharacterized protein n=1 Tax=Ktedonobacter robiniae TaxID=2778365 RepID=A0ABQ3UMI1_9CHLR|nr:hypothetical protein KSB_22970 [Ktedonobacter robiniae]
MSRRLHMFQKAGKRAGNTIEFGQEILCNNRYAHRTPFTYRGECGGQ